MSKIDNILHKYGRECKNGRITFNNYAYILIAKITGKEWRNMSHYERACLKGDMIEQYSGTRSTRLMDYEY